MRGATRSHFGHTSGNLAQIAVVIKPGTSVQTYGFTLQGGGFSQDVTIDVGGGVCVTDNFGLTITVTKNTGNICVGPGDPLPTYDITVSDGLTAGNRTYALAFDAANPAPPGMIFNGASTITITAGNANKTETNKVGGTAGAIGSYPFKVTVTSAAPQPVSIVPSAINTVGISAACQNNVLVVMVDPFGGGPAASEPLPKMNDFVKPWVARASFNQAVFNPFKKTGNAPDVAVELSGSFSSYNAVPKTMLKDLVGEVVAKLTAAPNQTLLDKVQHLVLFLNTANASDIGPVGYWAIPQMTYLKSDGVNTVTLGVSIHKNNADWKEVADGMGTNQDEKI